MERLTKSGAATAAALALAFAVSAVQLLRMIDQHSVNPAAAFALGVALVQWAMTMLRISPNITSTSTNSSTVSTV